MKNLNSHKIKFFLVAAAMISGMSSFAKAGTPDQDSTQSHAQQGVNEGKADYDFNGDPNADIGVPGNSVTDSATDKPLPVSCHDCEVAAHYSGPLGKQFGPNGDAATKSSDGAEAKQ